MKRFLALASLVLLGAGISGATKTVSNASGILTGAIAQSKLCEHQTLKVALDEEGRPKGLWSEDKDGKDVLAKLMSGDKHYLRALNQLEGAIEGESTDGKFRRIRAGLMEELPYSKWGFTFLKLRTLDLTLEQRLEDGKWVPEHFKLTIKYWQGLIGIGSIVHDKYKASFKCDASRASHFVIKKVL